MLKVSHKDVVENFDSTTIFSLSIYLLIYQSGKTQNCALRLWTSKVKIDLYAYTPGGLLTIFDSWSNYSLRTFEDLTFI